MKNSSNFIRTKTILPLLCFALACFGCDIGAPPPSTMDHTPAPVEEDAKVAEAPKEPELVQVKPGAEMNRAELQEAQKDVLSPIAVPVKVFLSKDDRAVFDMQIPKAMSLYKAMNDNKPPATEEEFMKDIIEANMIKLPTRYTYEYDPTTGELKAFR